jgi:2-iminobutanoate/2-iminopropanoate deaminase
MTTQSGPLLLTALALALGLPLAQGAAEHAAERSYIAPASPSGVPVAQSAAVRTGNTLYLAGQLGIDPLTGEIPAQRTAEARLLMRAVERTVAAAGLQMDDVVSVTVFSTDSTADETFNAVYQDYFHGHFPARAVVGASRLARGAHFELSAVAVRAPHLQL